MTKKSVVVASVLKPVNDSRNYEKMAISINRTGKYQVSCVGQAVQNAPIDEFITFCPIFSFQRLGWKRLFAGFVFLNYLIKTKPDWVMVTTFELLIPSVLYKIFTNCRLTYDVQENYFRNLWYGKTLPFGLKHLLAIKIRALEYMTRPFVNHYYLAERNYEKEFSFSKGKSTVLENKLRKEQVQPRVKRTDGFIQFLYTGTISENYGIFEAVRFIKMLHGQNDKVRLLIIGFASQKEVLQRFKKEIKEIDFIQLVGGDVLVPHEEILKQIAKADFGLVTYRPDKSTENCLPTKVYEYTAHQLPYLYSANSLWRQLTDEYDAGVEVDFTSIFSLSDLQSRKFYQKSVHEKDLYWKDLEWGDI